MKEKYTKLIIDEAFRLGFSACGISKARFLEEEAENLENWLKSKKNGEMSFMERNFDKRLNPCLMVNNAKSVISVSQNYFPQKEIKNISISKFAYGKDYHILMKKKLKKLMDFIKKNIGEVNGRTFVDSAPVLERKWAKLSGIGWVGKNANLINFHNGSFFFLGELIIDLELNYNNEISKNYCGTCRICVDACPTGAIEKEFVINANKCISYLTVEFKGKINENLQEKLNVFACDICQDLCPFNKKSIPNEEDFFQPKKVFFEKNLEDWKKISKKEFNEIFRESAIKRIKYEKFLRNLEFQKN